MNKIKCNFCKKNIDFEDDKIRTNKDMETLICQNCGRTIIIKLKGEKYYDTKL